MNCFDGYKIKNTFLQTTNLKSNDIVFINSQSSQRVRVSTLCKPSPRVAKVSRAPLSELNKTARRRFNPPLIMGPVASFLICLPRTLSGDSVSTPLRGAVVSVSSAMLGLLVTCATFQRNWNSDHNRFKNVS